MGLRNVSPILYDWLSSDILSRQMIKAQNFSLWILFKYIDSYWFVRLIISKEMSSTFSYSFSLMLINFECASVDQMTENIRFEWCFILCLEFVVNLNLFFRLTFVSFSIWIRLTLSLSLSIKFMYASFDLKLIVFLPLKLFKI